VLCKEFGWDFYTYELQPPWFLDELVLIFNQEESMKEQKQKESERRSKLARPMRR
jgi:hypothetical protein